jgi:hypothetical protein
MKISLRMKRKNIPQQHIIISKTQSYTQFDLSLSPHTQHKYNTHIERECLVLKREENNQPHRLFNLTFRTIHFMIKFSDFVLLI